MNTHYRHTTTTSESTTLDWSEAVECPHCHARWKARVKASGSGFASYDRLHGDREDAEARAGVGAFESAMSNAKSAIARARCPKCGERGQGAATVFAIHGVVMAVALRVLAFVALRWAETRGGMPPVVQRVMALSGMQITVACVVVAAAVAAFTTWNALSKADATVKFEEAFELPKTGGYR